MLIPEPEARIEGADFSPRAVAPVVLADGQTWYLPRPMLTIVPIFADEGDDPRPRVIRCWTRTEYPDPIGRLVAAMAAEADPTEVVRRVLTIAGLAMQRLYYLNNEELGQILAFSSDDPASGKMIKDIMDILVDNVPPSEEIPS